jgi:hydroxymethylpyrimidine pyrophosphatase-like HAD family hydrolase
MIGVVSDFDLVALDLDGTLLNSHDDISPRNRRAIAATLAAGIRVVLVTGRGVDVASNVVRELGLDVPVICAHGALTKDVVTGEVLGHIPVPLRYARPMIEFADRETLPVAVYANEHFYRVDGHAIVMEDMRGPGWTAVADFGALLAVAPTFIRFLGKKSVEAMRGRFGDLPLHFKYETWGDFEECAVTNSEATKENALRQLCDRLGVDATRVVAIGDSRNDVPMMQWAGVGIAMANALPEVRQAVGRVTASNEDDGVAIALEGHVLKEGGQRSA